MSTTPLGIGSKRVDAAELLDKVQDAMTVALNQYTRLAELNRDIQFPVDTGALREGVMMERIHGPDSQTLHIASKAAHAIYVEAMENVQWSNPLSRDHPHAHMREEIRRVAVQVIQEALQTLGFDIQ